jgi:16S rRNA (guanine527-N7)-methyltransferase
MEALGISPEPATIRQFLFYGETLLKRNARINLTGHKAIQEVVVKHFLDSLAVWPWVKDLASLADIGTGGGFPGLPLKLVLPELHLTLIEPTGKKTAFLNFVIAHLGLSNVEVRQVHLTAPLARRWGPLFQGVITRATFPLAGYLEIGAPLVEAGGRLLALKGPGLDEAEWLEAMTRAAALNFQTPEKREYRLPLTNERRLLVICPRPGSDRKI